MAKNPRPTASKKPSQRARLAAARQAQQEAKRRRERRTRLVAAVGVVVLIAVIGVLIQANRAGIDQDAARPAGVTEADGGVPAPGTATAGAPLIEVYEDFRCPHCKVFEEAVGSTLEQLAAADEARVVYRVVSFLDNHSDRAQAAAGCAADEGRFLDYHDILYAHQADGFSIDQLISYGAEAGLTSSAFQQCVRDETYASWADASTTAFSNRGVQSTPSVYINGERWQPAEFTPDGLLAVVAAAR